MADLKKHYICINFALHSVKMHFKCMKCSMLLLMTITWERHRCFNWFFLIQKWGNFEWRLWVFRLYLYRSHRRKRGKSLQNCPWRQMKYDVGDCWQVKPLTWNITVTCKGDLNMHQMSANFVPWLLTHEQKQWQFLTTKIMAVGPTFLTCLSWFLLIPSCFWEWSYSYEDFISLKFRNNHDSPSYGSEISVPALAGMLNVLN